MATSMKVKLKDLAGNTLLPYTTNIPKSVFDGRVKNSTISIVQDGTVHSFTLNQSDSLTITLADTPKQLSELLSDSTHRLVSDAQISNWNNKADTSFVKNPTVTIWQGSINRGSFTLNQSDSTSIVLSDGITAVNWGDIAGTLSFQTDLQDALDDKANSSDIKNSTITLKQGGVIKGSFTLNQSDSLSISLDMGGSTVADLTTIAAGGTMLPDGHYQITMTADTTLNAGGGVTGKVGAALLFINPGSYTFTAGDNLTLVNPLAIGYRNYCKLKWYGRKCRLYVVDDYRVPLTFTAVQANSTVALKKSGTPYLVNIQYSTDGGDTWNDYLVTTSGTAITLANIGDTVSFRNTLDNGLNRYNNGYVFVMTGKIAASGNVHSMLHYAELCSPYCFIGLFANCTSLTTIPLLPATQLADNCYNSMFFGCTSLTTVLLPATLLASYCCYQMFRSCTSLTTVLLPARQLSDYCYYQMFHSCTSLTTVLLPARQLADYCCKLMFYGCTSLTTAPELPATLLATGCYYSMFSHCFSLTTIPLLPATLLATGCYNRMFYYCTKLSSLTAKFTTWDTGDTPYWLYRAGTLATTTPVANIKVAPGTRSLDTIPSNWTINLI